MPHYQMLTIDNQHNFKLRRRRELKIGSMILLHGEAYVIVEMKRKCLYLVPKDWMVGKL